MNPMQLREDEIGRHLAQAHESGELRSAESYGKPLKSDEGWEQTPDEFRMGFKALRNAGVAPPEIEQFHQRAELRSQVQAAADEGSRQKLQRELSELEQRISLRLEAMKVRSSL